MVDIEMVRLHEIHIPLAHGITVISLVIRRHIIPITLLPHLHPLVLVMDILRINHNIVRSHDLESELLLDQQHGQVELVLQIDDTTTLHDNEITVLYRQFLQDLVPHRIPLDEMTIPPDLPYDESPLNHECQKINQSLRNLARKV